MKKSKIFELAITALFVALEITLVVTPLGYIPIGLLQITTMHIPVIIAAILLGEKIGAFIGLVFGLTSTIYAVLVPSLASLFFTPFYSIGEYSGNFCSLIIAIVPRVLLGYLSAVIYQFLQKKMNDSVSIVLSAIIATVLHTVMVMGFIYIFFKDMYFSVFSASEVSIFVFIGATLASNGIYESLLAGFLTLPVVKAINKVRRTK